MAYSSDYPNVLSTSKVRLVRGDIKKAVSYHPNMPRKAPDKQTGPDWYLQEWMATLNMRQADLGRLAGWSKATVSDIYNGRTAFYREMLNTVAAALNVKPFELLMHPSEAMALRRMRASAFQIASEIQEFQPEQTLEELLSKKSSG